MQFADLKDDSGKEIWEGDILEFDCEEMGVDIGVVRFSAHGHWTSQPEGMDEQILSEEVHQLKNKVIGNIYQNPELLSNP